MDDEDRTIIFGLVLIAAFLLSIMLIDYAFAVHDETEPDFYYWVQNPGQQTYRKVPVYLVEDITVDGCLHPAVDHVRGCYFNGITEAIFYVESERFDWSSQGCTVNDHEYFHAMGYQHHTGPLNWTCPNPSWSTGPGFQADVYKQSQMRDPSYMYKPVNPELDPRSLKYN